MIRGITKGEAYLINSSLLELPSWAGQNSYMSFLAMVLYVLNKNWTKPGIMYLGLR